MQENESNNKTRDHSINILNDIGIALSTENDQHQLLIKIVTSAMDLANADAASLYLLAEEHLTFEVFANRSLKMTPKRRMETDFPLASIPLYLANNQPNLSNIVTYCVLKNCTLNIDNAYQMEEFDFSGLRHSDIKLGYHSKSLLTIPLRSHENKIIGVLQLINALSKETGEIISFDKDQVHLAESLASQAAIALTRQNLIQAQKDLFEALLQLIAKAIDEKSRYTSNHCRRVPVITMMLAEAANNATTGAFKDFQLSSEQLEEVRIAAWLHDCGKISTPDHIMDKATKLAGVYDRIEVIDHRLEIIKRDIKITLLEKMLTKDGALKLKLENDYQTAIRTLEKHQATLKNINLGGEFLSEEDKQTLNELSRLSLQLNGSSQSLLSPADFDNLSVARGTLNEQEREVIKNHVTVTQRILASLPYPDYLKNVPEIAGNHHERVDGKGYPRGLTREAMSIQSRMVSIADIFEALTATDRPYKRPNTLSETLKIMHDMKMTGHIDPDLFDLFMTSKIYLSYAKQYLKDEQIDL